MEMRRVMVGEGLSCFLMVLMEGCTIGLTIMASTTMSRGMSPYVFVVYSNALSSIFLLPHSLTLFISQRESWRSMTSLLMRCFFLGLIGVTVAQNLAYVGLSYSSPILACGMGNLIPSFTFIISILSRKAKNEWSSSSFRAKVAGTLISIMGAVSITLYKGPVIKYSPSHQLQLHLSTKLFLFSSSHENWILGAILLAAASFTICSWNIIQVKTLEAYPEPMTIVSLYILFGTISSAVYSVFVERNISAWILKPNMELLVIILTAIFSSIIRTRVQKWCMRGKGPLYVPMFKPMGIPIATMCGCLFFAYSFHYGSIMGAFVVGLGTYTVMWGQITEDDVYKKNENGSMVPDEKTPLLQGDSQV
ncbi:hypothetical protein DCAR_0936067 [Daucus carota subsp. sativus]|uniref:WAT1-related protein n=1 Tax=Daucus carota subsp. sativus TaxID=79200 RepID=A0AAF0Y0W4_DAUCS|nr:PREDICTED: WAT1-related protein At1g70260 isoform X1 [Daucus carota subsp. sativus]XP_017224663.1 PREDICTED: WAT1-related protein At1g70260 isoform X2 [Daucus carota subsp. sativus]WOH16512.1 hypothetical protein DCAR_0936067 [Daucus carota subsp. sativus]